ncbi:MAG: type II toxin-antitoxin system RelE/ParE family toxin [Pseudomonadota bacterium]|nr:type II toxin-antitoxin system RelE/ParE family toxin [Pseudomonadota bacterium]
MDRTSEIAEYIAKDKPTVALDWVDKIFQKVDILKSSPELGRVVAEIRRKDVRELIFGNYRVIYRVEKTSISIFTVRHGKQILPVEEIEEIQA